MIHQADEQTCPFCLLLYTIVLLVEHRKPIVSNKTVERFLTYLLQRNQQRPDRRKGKGGKPNVVSE